MTLLFCISNRKRLYSFISYMIIISIFLQDKSNIWTVVNCFLFFNVKSKTVFSYKSICKNKYYEDLGDNYFFTLKPSLIVYLLRTIVNINIIILGYNSFTNLFFCFFCKKNGNLVKSSRL
jgi:hypothetical protein